MGLKDLLFEQEHVDNQEAAPESITIPAEFNTPNASSVLIDKSSPVGKLMDLVVALESTLPDKDLRYKVALTTLQAQGIDKDIIRNDVNASRARLSEVRNQTVKVFEDKMIEVQNLSEQREELLRQAKELDIQIKTTTSVLTNDKEKKLTDISKYHNQLDDIEVRIK